MLKGYCLKAKTWGNYVMVLCSSITRGARKRILTEVRLVYLYVDSVHEITWNKNSFNELVLPHDYKQIVLAFVHAQLSQRDDFDDVIKGKG